MIDASVRLDDAMAALNLVPIGRLAGGFRSEVMAANAPDGSQFVVKAPPRITEAEAEAAALSRWSATPAAVQLIHFDRPRGVLVLERLRPGTALPPNDPRSIDIAAGLLSELHQRADDGSFPLLEQRYPDAENQARRDNAHERRARHKPDLAAAGMRLLTAAVRTVQDLTRTLHQRHLLHGDFSNKNILATEDAFAAIDPIPALGDRCADVANFAATRSAPQIFPTATALSQALDLDPRRTARWTAIFVVLQTCQAWREDQPELDALVDTAEFQELLA